MVNIALGNADVATCAAGVVSMVTAKSPWTRSGCQAESVILSAKARCARPSFLVKSAEVSSVFRRFPGTGHVRKNSARKHHAHRSFVRVHRTPGNHWKISRVWCWRPSLSTRAQKFGDVF